MFVYWQRLDDFPLVRKMSIYLHKVHTVITTYCLLPLSPQCHHITE